MSDSTVVVGSIRGVVVQGREFPVPADCEAELHLGGYTNQVVRFGSGRCYIVQGLVPWMCAGVELVISDDRGDLGFLAGLFNAAVSSFAPGLSIPSPPQGPDRIYLKEIIERARFVPVTFTLADETTWAGSGTIIGSVGTSTRRGVARVDFAGDGELVKQ